MPFTPDVERPMGRSASSVASNRSDMPFFDTRRISSCSSASIAETSSSPSRQVDGDDAAERLVS
jgi:hypothetical protein